MIRLSDLLNEVRGDLFRASDQSKWPKGPFGKKGDFADYGGPFKKSKDWKYGPVGKHGLPIPKEEEDDAKETGYEKVDELELPKGKYVTPSTAELEDNKYILFDLIQNAYAPIGGHLKIKSPDDIMNTQLSYWKVADIDGDPDIDVTYFGKQTPIGIKHTGIGHDGDRSKIKNLLIQKTKELKKLGHFVEISGAAFDSFHTKGGVPIIDNEAKVRKVIQRDIKWHGVHPDGVKSGKGWYSRMIGGKSIIKTLAGTL